jgi:hypothetical protein
MTSLILNHRMRWSWRVNYTCRQVYTGKGNRHAFNGPHSPCGWFRRREKFLASTGIRSPDRSARSLVTTPTLISLCIPFNWAIWTEMRAKEIWFSRRGETKFISVGFHFCYTKKKKSFLRGGLWRHSVRSPDPQKSLLGPLSCLQNTSGSFVVRCQTFRQIQRYLPRYLFYLTKQIRMTHKQLNPRSRVHLGKLIVGRIINKFPCFIELHYLTSWLQQLPTRPCSDPIQSISSYHVFFRFILKLLLSHRRRGLGWRSG